MILLKCHLHEVLHFEDIVCDGDEAMKNSVLSSLSFNLLRNIHFWTSEIHEDNLCKQQAASAGIVGTKSKKIWMSSAYIWNLISCLRRISPTGAMYMVKERGTYYRALRHAEVERVSIWTSSSNVHTICPAPEIRRRPIKSYSRDAISGLKSVEHDVVVQGIKRSR